jgi:hypothetical protein
MDRGPSSPFLFSAQTAVRKSSSLSAALEPYSRSIGLDELIISLYSKFELERDPRYWRRYSRIDTQDPPSPG